jgi:hypothetical protein
MDVDELLTEAIRTRQQVTARYRGAERAFCPHALGTKRGVRRVLAYQFAGESRKGLPPGGEWRCLRVENLTDAALQPGAWHTAANVFNPQSCLDEVEIAVEPLPPLADAKR